MIDKNSGLLSLILGGYKYISTSKYKKPLWSDVKSGFLCLDRHLLACHVISAKTRTGYLMLFGQALAERFLFAHSLRLLAGNGYGRTTEGGMWRRVKSPVNNCFFLPRSTFWIGYWYADAMLGGVLDAGDYSTVLVYWLTRLHCLSTSPKRDLGMCFTTLNRVRLKTPKDSHFACTLFSKLTT